MGPINQQGAFVSVATTSWVSTSEGIPAYSGWNIETTKKILYSMYINKQEQHLHYIHKALSKKF